MKADETDFLLKVAEEADFETARLFSTFDWASSPLGPISSWPEALKLNVLMLLKAEVPMLIAWGEDLIQIYNDSYIDILGSKHPDIFGKSAKESWPEIQHFLDEQFQSILTGQSFSAKSLLLPLRRKKRLEEAFFTFSYSPLYDSARDIAGLISVAFDETDHVISRRRETLIDNLMLAGECDRLDDFLARCNVALMGETIDFRRFLIVRVSKEGQSFNEVLFGHNFTESQTQKILANMPSGELPQSCSRIRIPGDLFSESGEHKTAFFLPLRPSRNEHLAVVVVPHTLVRSGKELRTYFERVSDTLQSGIDNIRRRQRIVENLREELEETDIRYKLLFEGTDDGVLYTSVGPSPDAQEIILAANEAAAELLGYERAVLIGESRDNIYFGGDAIFQNALSTRHETGRFKGELRFQRADGRAIDLDVTSNMILDEEGGRKAITILRDATQRKTLEQRSKDTAKMDVLGQLTGGIAHDFNNLLTVIIGGADELCDSENLPETETELARLILSAAERGAGLTQHLLAYARRQSLHPRQADLNSLLKEFEPVLRSSLKENITLSFELDPYLDRVSIDVDQFLTVILNLAMNSRDAMPVGGEVNIATLNSQLPLPLDRPHGRLEPGRYVNIHFSDTGQGISHDLQTKVFEPFYTTKGVGEGTGLGLSMVHGFVTQSGGDVILNSIEGVGTTVSILLPSAQADIEPVSQ